MYEPISIIIMITVFISCLFMGAWISFKRDKLEKKEKELEKKEKRLNSAYERINEQRLTDKIALVAMLYQRPLNKKIEEIATSAKQRVGLATEIEEKEEIESILNWGYEWEKASAKYSQDDDDNALLWRYKRFVSMEDMNKNK